MSLSDAAAIASIISSVAVALSLVYLSIQVRQGEQNQRAMIQQGRADRVTNALLKLSEPGLAGVANKGAHHPSELTRDELYQFLNVARATFLSTEDSFLQHRAGLLDETAYLSFVAGVRSMLSTWPGIRAAWRVSSNQYGEDFAAFMNGIMDTNPFVGVPDRLANWNEVLYAETGGALGKTDQAKPSPA